MGVTEAAGFVLFASELRLAGGRSSTTSSGYEGEERQQGREPSAGAVVVVRRGRLNGFLCHTHRGPPGGMMVYGNLAPSSLEAVHVAVSWASACVAWLTRWLGHKGGAATTVERATSEGGRGGAARQQWERSLWRVSV